MRRTPVKFLSTPARCGASWISPSASTCANDIERARERIDSGSLPITIHTASLRAHQSQAQQRGRAPRKTGVQGSPSTTIQNKTPPRKTSQAQLRRGTYDYTATRPRHEVTTRATSSSLRSFSYKFSALGNPEKLLEVQHNFVNQNRFSIFTTFRWVCCGRRACEALRLAPSGGVKGNLVTSLRHPARPCARVARSL
jgi:hypothetical protein